MKKILVVEDEPAYLKLLNSQLTQKGYQVSTAIDGKEGLMKAQNENPDLILLDIKMPVMDGMAMLSALRREEKNQSDGRQAKVIILSNLEPDDHAIEELMSDKPLYYFVKSDIKLGHLLLKIHELLQE